MPLSTIFQLHYGSQFYWVPRENHWPVASYQQNIYIVESFLYGEIVVYLKWSSIHAMFHDSSWISIRTQSTINCHILLKIHTYFSPRKWIEVSCSTVKYRYCTRFKHCCMPCHCYHHVYWDIYWYNVSYTQRIALHWP